MSAVGASGVAKYIKYFSAVACDMFVHPAVKVKGIVDFAALKIFRPREGGDGTTSRGESHFVAPVTDAVLAAAIGANFHPIGGVRREAGERIGIFCDGDGILFTAVHAELPYGGSTVLRPTQVHTSCPRYTSRKGGRCYTRYGGGKGHGIARSAGAFNSAVAYHAHLIFGFWDKTGDGGPYCVHIEGLPSAGGNRMTQNQVVNMHIIVTVAGDG